MPDFLLLSATLLFAISVRLGAVSGVFALTGALSLIGSVGLSKRAGQLQDPDPRAIDSRLLVGAGLFGLLGLIGWSPATIGPSSIFLDRLPGAIFIGIVVVAFALRRRSSQARFLPLVLGALITVAGFGAAHIEATGDLGFDVYHLHVSAAEALGDGENPYTDVVTVPDGSPNAERGDVISGYVYPPTTLVGYSLGHWLTPDARYTSLLSWLVVLGILGFAAVRNKSDRELNLMLLLASLPGLWLVLRAAWTEPLSIMFAAVATALWTHRAASGLGLGAMLSSKQYFLVTAPVFLLHRETGWMRRAAAALAVITLTLVPAMLWDFGAFWDSAVAFHTSTEPRPDGSNIVGLLAISGVDWTPPTLLPVVLGLAVAVWAAAGSTTRRSFMAAMATSLSVSFLVTSQAFANYWFLVFGLCALAMYSGPEGSGSELDPL